MTKILNAFLGALFFAGASAELRADKPLMLGETLSEFSLYDTKRRMRSWEDYPESKALGFIFVSTECPLVNLYLPTLQDLQTEFADKNVHLLLVNADPADSFNRVAGHRWEHELDLPVLKDFSQTLAQRLGATRTPEVFLFDSAHQLVYQGQIDDQYTVTHRRPKAKQHSLKKAIQQVLDAKPVAHASTEATGCVIQYEENPFAEKSLTYTQDIKSIVANKCLECHQAGRVGQISFTSHRQLKRFSATIREVVLEQRMPPWYADPHYGEFLNQRSLDEDERAMLLAWIDSGCPKGDRDKEPAEGKQITASDWTIGEPDLVLSMPVEEKVPASGVLDYQYYTVDPGFTEDVWIQAAEAKPGNAEVVHHVIAYIVAPGKKVFDRDGETAILVGWAPGDMPAEYPEGIARRIPAGSKLRFELHYTPNGTATVDRSSVGIRFAKERPAREIHTNIMWQRELSIPAGKGWHEDSSTYTFREAARILSLMPHMHLRGIAAKYVLRLPDGKTETILSVPNYDFNWQSVYRFKEPLLIPKGAQLTVTGAWDNSTDNPNNPDASRVVPWGDQTFDEMLNGWVDFVYEKADSPRDLASIQ